MPSCTAFRAQQLTDAPYKNPNVPTADRVRDVLGRMTVEEKVAQLESQWTMPSIGGFKFPSVFENDKVKDEMARRFAGNALGTSCPRRLGSLPSSKQ